MDDTTLNGIRTDLGTNGANTSSDWRGTYAQNGAPVDHAGDRRRCFAYDCTRPPADAGAALCRTHRKRYLEVSS